jgi:hypothetical protein
MIAKDHNIRNIVGQWLPDNTRGNDETKQDHIWMVYQ